MTPRGPVLPTTNIRSVGQSALRGKPNGVYISIDVWLDCGCEIRDLQAFAKQMRDQKGWDIATTGGWGSSTDSAGRTYLLRARRRSLVEDDQGRDPMDR
jgi:hypothetical protein